MMSLTFSNQAIITNPIIPLAFAVHFHPFPQCLPRHLCQQLRVALRDQAHQEKIGAIFIRIQLILLHNLIAVPPQNHDWAVELGQILGNVQVPNVSYK